MGVAGDGDPCCWESDGVTEGSLPSGVDLIEFIVPQPGGRHGAAGDISTAGPIPPQADGTNA